jgi:PAS domain-containing protein
MLGIAAQLTTTNEWRLAAAAGLACFLLGLAAALLLRRPAAGAGLKGRLLDLTLNNMTQGVVMFDHAGRLVVRNDRYLGM